MRRKADKSTRHSDVSLTERYGNIGISAVAAAARYHGRDDKAPEGSDDQNEDRTEGKAGTSPPRS